MVNNKDENLEIMYFETIQNSLIFFLKISLYIIFCTYCISNYEEIGSIITLIIITMGKISYPSVTYKGGLR